MQLRNEFNIPVPPDRAWDLLLDVPGLIPCVPGATLVETIGERSYKGKVTVKIGPLALTFSGAATFEDVDPVKYLARVKAQGNDTKGRGGASAIVSFRLSPSAGGSSVSIETDLNLTGSVAQYGRGVGIIQSVATELTDQFAENLRAKLASHSPAAVNSSGTDANFVGLRTAIGPFPSDPVPISGMRLLLRSLWRALWGRAA